MFKLQGSRVRKEPPRPKFAPGGGLLGSETQAKPSPREVPKYLKGR